MKILIGSIGISAAVVSFCIVLLGARNPMRPKWATDALIGELYCPLLVSSGLVGIALFFSGLYNYASNGTKPLHVTISSVILAAALICVKALNVRKKLATYGKPAEDGGPDDQSSSPECRGETSEASRRAA